MWPAFFINPFKNNNKMADESNKPVEDQLQEATEGAATVPGSIFEPAQLSGMKGHVADMLRRAPARVREDRGLDVLIDLKTIAQRKIEDYQLNINRKEREKRNLYDFSGTNALSMMKPDVDASDIEERDEQLGIEIHQMTVKLELRKKSFNERFDKIYQINENLISNS